MQVTEIRAEGLKRVYQGTATAAEIEARVDAKIEEVRPTAQLKGFRKGKAPRDLLKKLFGKSMMGEVMQQVVDEGLRGHLETSGHKPAAQPEVKLVNEDFTAGDDLQVEFSYELMPDTPEVVFSEIKLERLVVTPSATEIDEALGRLAENAKTYETKEGAAEAGDQTVIDFVGRVGGDAFEGGSAEDFPLELGAGRFIPGFEDQLVGASAGEARDVTVTFPEDYGAQELAGKEAVFSVTVKDVRGPKPAAIDDALAEKYGAESLDAMKAQLTERLAGEYRGAARSIMKRQLLDALSDRLAFDVPESMREPEARQIAHQLWHEAHPEVQGHDHPEIEPDDEARALAARRVRLGLVLADIGSKNQIEVADAELANAAAAQARQYPGQEKEVYEFLMKDQRMRQQLSGPVFEDKVVDYIFELADVTDKSATADELRAAMDEMNARDGAATGSNEASEAVAEGEAARSA